MKTEMYEKSNPVLYLVLLIVTCLHALVGVKVEPHVASDWELFKQTYNKSYTREEEIYRQLLWKRNCELIRNHNNEAKEGKHSFFLGINHFGDMTTEEINNGFNGLNATSLMATLSVKRNRTETNVNWRLNNSNDVITPKAVDWRKHGYVTAVKFQKYCGACYAFSATGALEGQHFRKTGKLVSLSEQNLVDCTVEYGNHGCNGGYMDNAFRYITKNHGIDTEQAYPYNGEVGACQFRPKGRGATCSGFHDVTKGDETALREAVTTVGPISIGIDAGSYMFHFYLGGIFNNPECSPVHLNHGVLVVGYGSENGQDYWIVKNSWGSWWGEKGYIRMLRNHGNQCGVASLASYPIV